MREREEAVAERTSGVLVVEVRGELDIATVLRWTTLIEAAICELPEPHLLVLDLASLEFLSAHGAGGLLEAMKCCRDRGIAGCLIVTPGSVADRVVRLTGLADRVRVFPNRLTAIAACQPEEVRWLPA
ncbi:STAS domain-containing protein [Amycolatopsis mongoliensis]|uniref:Anti-sigma factor antagonist n=1 Tax=Amycolatopsis mongoliensis TaxID=715475 RepID=A0A9Y2NH06_9PSEU|nr:STAS domain-containing protein [Amycolatopsis sp. 4-36]WIY01379.1 STAS domain-containing protein [Amycolatopsis sp. 4-36]